MHLLSACCSMTSNRKLRWRWGLIGAAETLVWRFVCLLRGAYATLSLHALES